MISLCPWPSFGTSNGFSLQKAKRGICKYFSYYIPTLCKSHHCSVLARVICNRNSADCSSWNCKLVEYQMTFWLIKPIPIILHVKLVFKLPPTGRCYIYNLNIIRIITCSVHNSYERILSKCWSILYIVSLNKVLHIVIDHNLAYL